MIYNIAIVLGMGFPGGSVVKNLPANVGAMEDTGSISGSGRSPGERNGTEELGRLQSRGSSRVRHDGVCTHVSFRRTAKRLSKL